MFSVNAKHLHVDRLLSDFGEDLERVLQLHVFAQTPRAVERVAARGAGERR